MLTGYTANEIRKIVRDLHVPRQRRHESSKVEALILGTSGDRGTIQGRPPKWQAIRDYVLRLPRSGGFAHSTDDVYRSFFGRKITYTNPIEMPLAKTTATNIRKAHSALALDLKGRWEASMTGARSNGGTKAWKFVPEVK